MFTKNIEKIFLFLLFMLCANILCPNELNQKQEDSSKDMIKNDIIESIKTESIFIANQHDNKKNELKNIESTFVNSKQNGVDFNKKQNDDSPKLQQPITLPSDNFQLQQNIVSDKKDDNSTKVPKDTWKLLTRRCLSRQVRFFQKISKKILQCPSLVVLKKDSCDRKQLNDSAIDQSNFKDVFLKTLKDEKLNISSHNQNDTGNIVSQNESIMGDSLVGSLIRMKPTPVSSQDMLSFEEWRSKISEQMEKNRQLEQAATNAMEPIINEPIYKDLPNSNVQKVKLSTNRARNFASHECGAKIVDSNSEANFVNRVLNEQMDEYMLNPCKIKNWFIIELCETIQPQYLEMANFELYSSIPKEFTVHASEHYPNRKDWSSLGNFTASDIRSLQGFKLQNNGFVKYLKIELLSFYGSEHYCPVSLIRVFGTSLFDEVERIDNPDTKSIEFPNEDDKNAVFEESLQKFTDLDLFGSAKNAVVNVVMKAFNFTLINQLLFKDKLLDEDSDENFNIFNQSKIVRLYSTFEKVMLQCENYFFPPTTFVSTTNQTLNIPKKCIFFQILFHDQLFNVMSTQFLIRKYLHNYLFFQCSSSNETHYDPNSTELVQFTSNNSILTNKLNDETSSANLILEKLDTTFASSTVLNNLVPSVNVTLEPSITDPIIMQTIMNTLPQANPSIIAVPISESILSSISSKINDSMVINDNSRLESVPMIPTNFLESESDIQSLSSMSGQSKEAVIIRLTNRIKNLEKNISLMSTYLENLSVRYRKQMEEMQKIFNQTLDHFNTSARIAAEKDMKQQEHILRLQNEISFLNQRFANMFHEVHQNNWLFLKIHIALMLIELSIVGISCLIFYIGFKRNLTFLTNKQQQTSSPIPPSLTNNTQRKNSFKFCTDKSTWVKKNDNLHFKNHHRSKSMPEFKPETDHFEEIGQLFKFVPDNNKDEDPMNQTDCVPNRDNDNDKENQTENLKCDDAGGRERSLTNGSSCIKMIAPDILKVINQ